MKQTAHISEIFCSVQGEGPYAGVRQVFVRFFGCHMHCVWCDTPESIGDTSRKFKVMTINKIMASIKSLYKQCHSVSLTGGEPLLQADVIHDLIPQLNKLEIPVYLETSGVLHGNLAKLKGEIAMISMDFKLPSSTSQRAFWQEHEIFLKTAVTQAKEVFVKIVISKDTQVKEVLRAAGVVAGINPQMIVYLQPNTYDLPGKVGALCLDLQRQMIKSLPNTRVAVQMHKFLNIR